MESVVRVSGSRCGRVVNPVAHEADHVPLTPEGTDDPFLVRRREARE